MSFCQTSGDQWDFLIDLVDGNGDPYDLTGAEIVLTLKRHLTDTGSGVLQVSTTSEHITVEGDATDGVARVKVGEDLTTIPGTVYYYDVQIRKPGWIGPKTTDSGDDFEVLAQVTLT